MEKSRFRLRYEVVCDLSIDELWPDGDAPDDPAEEDVEDLIEACGGWGRVLVDWNLDESAETAVTKVQS